MCVWREGKEPGFTGQPVAIATEVRRRYGWCETDTTFVDMSLMGMLLSGCFRLEFLRCELSC